MIDMTVEDLYYNLKRKNIVIFDKLNDNIDLLKIGILKDNIDTKYQMTNFGICDIETIRLDKNINETKLREFKSIFYDLYAGTFEDFKNKVLSGDMKVVGRVGNCPDKFSFLSYSCDQYQELKYDPDRNWPEDICEDDLKSEWYATIIDRQITDEQIDELKRLYKERK